MNNKENKSSKNYFENILSLLTTIRNVVVLMLGFLVISLVINSIDFSPGWCGRGLPPLLDTRFHIEKNALKSTAHSLWELEKDFEGIKPMQPYGALVDKYYSHLRISSEVYKPIKKKPHFIPQSKVNHWKLWQNHQNRVHQILYNH